MKYNIISLFILSLTVLSCQKTVNENKVTTSIISNVTNQNLDGTITIQGRVIVKGTNTPPRGITTMNVANKWVTKEDGKTIFGENKNVYVNKNGYYNITIDKGDTLVLIPNQHLYDDFSNYTFTNLQQSQILNIVVKENYKNIETLKTNNPFVYNNLQHFLVSSQTSSKLITVSGVVYGSKSKKPLKNVVIAPNFITNTNATGTYHLTNDKGQFTLTTLNNVNIDVNPLSPKNSIRFSASQDTVVNIFLHN